MICDHCGESCDEPLVAGDLTFCCEGCRWVFGLLRDKDPDLYDRFRSENLRPPRPRPGSYEYLDLPEVSDKFLHTATTSMARTTLRLPAIHCSACVWLLENLPRLEPGVLDARVDFLRKEIAVRFDRDRLRFSGLAQLLSAIGYPPDLSSSDRATAPVDRNLTIRLGVAGFCFGNIMLLSLPEYLSVGAIETELKTLFVRLSAFLTLPALFSAGLIFRSAVSGLRQKRITMDVPVSLGLLTLTGKSFYDLFTASGPGYFDSIAGLIFFLLLGKVFQSKTFAALRFERDYRDYFPLAVRVFTEGGEIYKTLSAIVKGDRLLLRHQEIVPCDGSLEDRGAWIDYSFVTGESEPVFVGPGEPVLAGGRVSGGSANVRATSAASESYLLQLWREGDDKAEERLRSISDRTASVFTLFVITAALGTGIYWGFTEPVRLWTGVTSVLIVACGCGLPLSIPFTFGTIRRVLARAGLFLKNDAVVERLAKLDTLVFDKTGTLTVPGRSAANYEGRILSAEEVICVRSLAEISTHPKSRALSQFLASSKTEAPESYEEHEGAGILGVVSGKRARIGSARWIGSTDTQDRTWIEIDGVIAGSVEWRSSLRTERSLKDLSDPYRVVVLSGDSERDRPLVEAALQPAAMEFRRMPLEKKESIRRMQQEGAVVAMIGDGLNDAGALKQSDVGIAVSDKTGSFAPGCDAILNASELGALPEFLALARRSMPIVRTAFAFTGLYNAVALTLAVTGHLSPVAAAVIMPVSTISTVGLCTGLVFLCARRLGLISTERP